MSEVSELAWERAREIASHSFSGLSAETIELTGADRRTLAEDVLALVDLPTADNSAMDGWAVSGNGPWRIVGDALIGGPLVPELQAGNCVRVGTGSVLPIGTSAVLRWEDAVAEGNELNVQPDCTLIDGKDIRPAGQECRAGDLLIGAGEVLTPSAVGLIAASGHDQVCVVREPRVAVLLFGDELIHTGIPTRGQVRDSLGVQLPQWIVRLGGAPLPTQIVPDQLEAVVRALRDAIAQADVIVTSGSTADGPHDFLHEALTTIEAELLVDRVRVRPGHPMLLARADGKPVIGLPGNPQSAVVGLMTLGAPVLAALLGQKMNRQEQVTVTEDFNTPKDFSRLVIGRNENSTFVSVPWVGSNMLRGLAASQGFAVVPPEGVTTSTTVEWLALP